MERCVNPNCDNEDCFEFEEAIGIRLCKYCGWENPEPPRTAGPSETPGCVPDILYDGYAVLQEVISVKNDTTVNVNHVSEILDAIVRLIRCGT